jgi:hypothetical protein
MTIDDDYSFVTWHDNFTFLRVKYWNILFLANGNLV